jgi:hypothetical protein
MAKVDQSGECWRWTGSHTAGGRPQVNFDRQPWYVYRLLYTWLVGSIPEGMTLDHFACDNGWCVNPAHCRPVANSENVRRGLEVRYAGRDSCPAGHPRSEYGKRDSRGKLWCTECNRIKCLARYTPSPRIEKTTCPAGHPRSEYGKKYAHGWNCRECGRIRAQERRRDSKS